MEYPETHHWCLGLPLESLQSLSLYGSLSHTIQYNDAAKSILSTPGCKKEKKLLLELEKIEKNTTRTVGLDTCLLSHLATECERLAKYGGICAHSSEFLSRFLFDLMQRDYKDICKRIIAEFDAVFLSKNIRNATGEMVSFPLPNNYVIRREILSYMQEYLKKVPKTPQPKLIVCVGKWLILTGTPGCGKTALVAGLLRQLQVLKYAENVTALKFAEDTRPEEFVRSLAGLKSRTASIRANDLLVLDDFNPIWSEALNVELNNITGMFKHILVTTRSDVWSNFFKAKMHVVKVPEGFKEQETVHFFCNIFKSSLDKITPPLMEVLESIHSHCNGSPIKLRIIFTAAKRFFKLSAQATQIPQWKQFLESFKKNTGVFAFDMSDGMSERPVDSGWTLVTTNKLSPEAKKPKRAPLFGRKSIREEFQEEELQVRGPVHRGLPAGESHARPAGSTRVARKTIQPGDRGASRGLSPRARQVRIQGADLLQPGQLTPGRLTRSRAGSVPENLATVEVHPGLLRHTMSEDQTGMIEFQADDIAKMVEEAPRAPSAPPELEEDLDVTDFSRPRIQISQIDPMFFESRSSSVMETESITREHSPLLQAAPPKFQTYHSTEAGLFAPASPQIERTASKFAYTIHNELLGVGRSKVFKGVRDDNGEILAVKRIVLDDDQNHEEEIAKVSREFNVLSQLNHVNVLRYFDLDIVPADKLIILAMEYCAGGCLKTAAKLNGRLPIFKVQNYLRQLLDGLTYLHSQKVCHLDLKGENIFLTHSDEVKIGDFGEFALLEKSFSVEPDDNSEPVGNIGTVQYMSPEMIRGQDDLATIGQPSDVWSFGCVALELLTGRIPKFVGRDKKGNVIEISDTWSIMFYVGSEGRPQIPDDLDDRAADLLNNCLKRDFGFRWSTSQLKRHKFFLASGAEPLSPEVPHPDGEFSYAALRQQLLAA